MQLAFQVYIRFTPQLITDISRVLQKLLEYFNGITISTTFALPEKRVLSVILTLRFNNSESVML